MGNKLNVDLLTFSPTTRISSKEIIQKPELPKGIKILVIGAGVFGGWTALHLLRSGYRVTLADCWGPGNSRSSSGGESRLIRAIYGDNRKYFNMAKDALSGWQELEAMTGRQILYQTGILWLFHKEGKMLRTAITRILEKGGWPYQIIPQDKIPTYYPMIKSEDLDSILVEMNAGYLHSRYACQMVTRQFIEEGGNYEQSWINPGNIKGPFNGVKINGITRRFDTFVFACGPWLPQMFPELLGKKLNITRQEVHYFGVPKDKSKILSKMLPWVDWDPGVFYYGVPGQDNRGFKVACDIRGEIVDPTGMERNPYPQNIEQSRKFLSRRFPGLEGAPLIESRICQYSDTLDGNFILDFHPEAENIWLIGGGSGHGFKHGPAFGKIAAEIICGEKPLDPDFVLPD